MLKGKQVEDDKVGWTQLTCVLYFWYYILVISDEPVIWLSGSLPVSREHGWLSVQLMGLSSSGFLPGSTDSLSRARCYDRARRNTNRHVPPQVLWLCLMLLELRKRAWKLRVLPFLPRSWPLCIGLRGQGLGTAFKIEATGKYCRSISNVWKYSGLSEESGSYETWAGISDGVLVLVCR